MTEMDKIRIMNQEAFDNMLADLMEADACDPASTEAEYPYDTGTVAYDYVYHDGYWAVLSSTQDGEIETIAKDKLRDRLVDKLREYKVK